MQRLEPRIAVPRGGAASLPERREGGDAGRIARMFGENRAQARQAPPWPRPAISISGAFFQLRGDRAPAGIVANRGVQNIQGDAAGRRVGGEAARIRAELRMHGADGDAVGAVPGGGPGEFGDPGSLRSRQYRTVAGALQGYRSAPRCHSHGRPE